MTPADDLRPPRTIEEVEATVERGRARRESRARATAVLYPLATAVVLIAVWEAATRAFAIPVFLLPPPSAVVTAFNANAALLLRAGWVTTVEIVLGYLLSIAVGVPLALAIFLWPPFARSIYPLLSR